MKFRLLTLLLASTISVSPLLALDDGSGFLSEVALSSTNNLVISAMNDVAMQETVRPTDRAQLPTKNSQKISPTYTPNKSRTQSNLQAFAERLANADSASATQTKQLFATSDVIGAVQNVMDQYGLERDNVAHAYALYWVVYWGLANKVYDAPSSKTMRAVAAQVEGSFSTNAEFANMDNAQKQAAAEELMALAAILDTTSEEAKSDPMLAAQAAKASLEGSRKSGLDLDKMTLTENGFVPVKGKKRADASDVVAGEEKALASATPSEDAAGGPNYALIAGAAGAGLGLAFLIGKAAGKKG